MTGAVVDTADFYFRGGPSGCLLIHGFSGTPYEMRPLGESLRDRGWTVRGVRLPGHATHGSELFHARWRDWYAAALAGLEDLARECDEVAAVGLSMGSLLALRLAAERADSVARIAVMAPALVLSDDRPARLAPLLRLAAPLVPARLAVRPKLGSDIADEEARGVHPRFPLPLRGIAELVALQRAVRPLLPRIRQPALLLHGRLDSTCPLVNLEILERELGSARIEKRIFERSAHILPVDAERDEVAAELLRFLTS